VTDVRGGVVGCPMTSEVTGIVNGRVSAERRLARDPQSEKEVVDGRGSSSQGGLGWTVGDGADSYWFDDGGTRVGWYGN
jgi:hypothetical protein